MTSRYRKVYVELVSDSRGALEHGIYVYVALTLELSLLYSREHAALFDVPAVEEVALGVVLVSLRLGSGLGAWHA